MNAAKITGMVLIIISLFVGYIGFNKVSDNTKEINVLGIVKIDASNEKGQTQGYMYLGLGVLLFSGGLYALKSKK